MADSFLLPSDLVVGKQDLIYASSKCQTQELLQMLHRHRIVAMPVWDDEGKRWIGIIDMLDIVGAHRMLDWSSTTLDLRELFVKFKASTISAGEVVKSSSRSQHLIIVCPGESLLNSMQYLTENHRILIGPKNSAEPKSFRLLSQMDIARELAKTDLGENGKRKIEELFPPKAVYSVKEDDIARDAFEQMYERNLSALAVVDKNGILVTNLSSSDLKTLDEDNIGNITLKVNQFLLAAHGVKPAVPIVSKPGDHLEDILPKLLIAQVHRVWITDSVERPIGVVSLTDITKLLTSSPPMAM